MAMTPAKVAGMCVPLRPVLFKYQALSVPTQCYWVNVVASVESPFPGTIT